MVSGENEHMLNNGKIGDLTLTIRRGVVYKSYGPKLGLLDYVPCRSPTSF